MRTAADNMPATMRWAPRPGQRATMISAVQTRAVTYLATALNATFAARARDSFGILMYHRISPRVPGLPPPSINVTPERFRLQLEGLTRRGFIFWQLRRVLAAAAAGEAIPQKVVVVTFDDGFENVYTHAVPVLRALDIPATIFINTAFLDSESPMPFDHWGLDHQSTAPVASYRPLTREQCRQLLNEPLIELGAHTHTHQDFRGRACEFKADLQTCVAQLSREFGLECPTFAFPYGTPHLGFAAPDLMAAAKSSGVRCALTTESALVQTHQSPFGWGRLNVFPWDNGATLAARLNGWYCWAPRLQRKISRSVRSGVGKLLNSPRTSDITAGTCVNATRNPIPVLADAPQSCVQACVDQVRPLISIVVPTFNRAHWLGDAIDSLVQQHTADQFEFEIVISDNASADSTADVVSAAALNTSVPIRYVLQSKPGDGPTRNAGVREARGEWLAFFDDDQFANPTWLLELWNAQIATGAKIVGGPVHLDLSPAELQRIGPICRKALREITFYDALHPYVNGDLPGTGNALVAREVFETIGEFDETMTGGGSDSDFFMRAQRSGFELWYSPRAGIRHRIPAERLSREYFRWDALSGGAGYAALIDHKQGGLPRVLAMCTARVLHGLAVNLPLLVRAHLRGDAGEVLGRRTLLWRAEGYLRQTLALAAPRLFAQRAFFEYLDFRQGRTLGQSDKTTISMSQQC